VSGIDDKLLEKEHQDDHKETGLANPDFMITSLATDVLQKKGIEYSVERQRDTEKAIGRLAGLFEAIVKEKNLSFDKADVLRRIADTLDEAHGNFGKEKTSFPDFVAALADDQFEVGMKAVDPLEYFGDVGNIASVDSLQMEKDRLSGEIGAVEDTKQKARALSGYIDETHHVGVDHDMYKRDLERGKDHNATMKYLLGKVAAGEALAPGFVGRFVGASDKYGLGKTGEALDGTHRATVCAVTGTEFFVIEVDMDKMISWKK
jgi:hypothetical protein